MKIRGAIETRNESIPRYIYFLGEIREATLPRQGADLIRLSGNGLADVERERRWYRFDRISTVCAVV